MALHRDRLFSADTATRNLSRALFETVENLPIISPHGHTDPSWFADNATFPDPANLFVIPDHYVVRMLISQGHSFESLGIGADAERSPRKIWKLFAQNYHLFRGTPSKLWIDHALEHVFGVEERLTANNANAIYDALTEKLKSEEFKPRALYDRFNIEVIATTDSALDNLAHHQKIAASSWSGRVLPTYRPDAVVDPDYEGFAHNIARLGELTGADTATWNGYLEAHAIRRKFFIDNGATATDHGHPTAQTLDLPVEEASALYQKVLSGKSSPDENEAFRAQMLTECARLSLEDGLVMQLHAGSVRNHNAGVFAAYGRDKGFDIPSPISFTKPLQPLLNAVGMNRNFSLILFTLDETTYSRELAPLAGAYPSLRLGPPWWFHDSFEGMRRFRQAATETAGFYNTAGFNDDTRAFCSIPARHDVARRCDCAYLTDLVTTHRLDEEEAFELAPLLAHGLAKSAYKL